MKVIMPQELEVWYVLPAIRSRIASELSILGLKQKEIAKILGITGAAVSQYVSKKRASNFDFDFELKIKIKNSSKKIFKKNEVVLTEISNILSLVKKRKLLCRIHKKHGFHEKNCKVCL